ncbi:hypothetical protein [Nocardia sp. alder85J]|uniref:hypothetical protein n=1 Tax=Nocardia sp. alder85J TaxID=2862949 RepID=UPI001CD6DD7D|nr:hypothetical protein [Nocardia sp. alder85J]MCX4096920.1 hypothetical protein [Nocardia sp. alder85J]
MVVKSKLLAPLFIALAAGVMTVPAIGAASASPVDLPGLVHQQPPGPWDRDHDGDHDGWGGFERPGFFDPRDPFHNDWHCDRRGRWHDDEHDRWGHDDFGRCHVW